MKQAIRYNSLFLWLNPNKTMVLSCSSVVYNRIIIPSLRMLIIMFIVFVNSTPTEPILVFLI